MPSRSSLAWLEPLDIDDAITFSPPNLKDFFVPGTMNAYSSVAMAGILSAALAIGLGLGRPAVFAVVTAAHCVVAGLVFGGGVISARVWPMSEADDSSQTRSIKL